MRAFGQLIHLLIWRTLTRDRLRTLITVLGVSLGVVGTILAVAIVASLLASARDAAAPSSAAEERV